MAGVTAILPGLDYEGVLTLLKRRFRGTVQLTGERHCWKTLTVKLPEGEVKLTCCEEPPELEEQYFRRVGIFQPFHDVDPNITTFLGAASMAAPYYLDVTADPPIGKNDPRQKVVLAIVEANHGMLYVGDAMYNGRGELLMDIDGNVEAVPDRAIIDRFLEVMPEADDEVQAPAAPAPRPKSKSMPMPRSKSMPQSLLKPLSAPPIQVSPWPEFPPAPPSISNRRAMIFAGAGAALILSIIGGWTWWFMPPKPQVFKSGPTPSFQRWTYVADENGRRGYFENKGTHWEEWKEDRAWEGGKRPFGAFDLKSHTAEYTELVRRSDPPLHIRLSRTRGEWSWNRQKWNLIGMGGPD